MLYYGFKDYEGFKEIFGIVEHGNGVKSRKNKILLSVYKDREQLHRHILCKQRDELFRSHRHFNYRYHFINDTTRSDAKKNLEKVCAIKDLWWEKYVKADDNSVDLLDCYSLPVLKNALMNALCNIPLRKNGCNYSLSLMGILFYSDQFETDNFDGLCEDGTLNAIRYRNMEKQRIFKMKAGRMFNHIMSCNTLVDSLPEQIKRWLSEEFVADWIEYARKNIGCTDYELHVDDNFSDIYDADCCKGYDEDSDSFGSCMVGDDQWTFYRDAVKAKAAYLTDKQDMIVARCIVFTDVHDCDSDKIWRLAERQYSCGCEPSLQRQLIGALISGGHIDGYKRVGASCSDSRGFLDIDGNSLEDNRFWIDCHLEDGDTISYQDSFKYYDVENQRADNYGWGSVDLATTESEVSIEVSIGERNWSEYNDEYIDDDDSTFVETRDDYFYNSQVVYANVYSGNGHFYHEDCFEGDCITINGEYYYAGRNAEEPEFNGISYCEECGEYFVTDEGVHSNLTDEYYCCDDCRSNAEERWHEDNGEKYSEWDGEWYDDDEVIEVYSYTDVAWKNPHYKKTTISIESFNDLVEQGDATVFCGEYFIDRVNYEGEPVHEDLLSRVA